MPEKREEMSESVAAKPREGKFNKNAARRVRAAGKIPAVVYGAAQASVAVEVDPKQILAILHSESGHNSIFDLDVAGHGKGKVMIVDWQYEPIKDTLLHVDLKRIALDKAMTVSVPVHLIGTPTGVKNEGGILDQVLREVEVECLPTEIPSHIDVDVTGLGLHGVVRVSDLPHDKVSKTFKFVTAEDATVAHVVAVRAEAEPAADAAAPAEPEVAKKGKADAPAADAKK